MYSRMMKKRIIAVTVILTASIVCSPAVAGPDVSGKVVLANLDRYDAYLRVGKTRREIKPKKASVLSSRIWAD